MRSNGDLSPPVDDRLDVSRDKGDQRDHVDVCTWEATLMTLRWALDFFLRKESNTHILSTLQVREF